MKQYELNDRYVLRIYETKGPVCQNNTLLFKSCSHAVLAVFEPKLCRLAASVGFSSYKLLLPGDLSTSWNKENKTDRLFLNYLNEIIKFTLSLFTVIWNLGGLN